MGDYFQAFVFSVAEEDVPAVSIRLFNYMVTEGLIQSEPSDCTLGSEESSYAPGPNYSRVVDEPDEHLQSLVTNGLEILATRSVEVDPRGTMTANCSSCCKSFEPGEELFSAISAWYDGDDGASLSCPICGSKRSLVSWVISPQIGLGNLVLKFWNWPFFKESFKREIERVAGSASIQVDGKL